MMAAPTSTRFTTPMVTLFNSAEHNGQHPHHLGGIYVNVIPERPTLVPTYKRHEPFLRSNGRRLLDGLRASHQALLARNSQRTANATRFTGNSSVALTFPDYAGPGQATPAGASVIQANASAPSFLTQRLGGVVPVWLVGVLLVAFYLKSNSGSGAAYY